MIKLTEINPIKETRTVYVYPSTIAHFSERKSDTYTSIFFIGGSSITVQEPIDQVFELIK